MSDNEILEKAIQKAIDNGWVLDDLLFTGEMSVGAITYWFDDDHGNLLANNLIWRHDFAKALWGEKQSSHEGQFADGAKGFKWVPDWQYHLQQMVISNDPIQYLGEHLDD